MKAELQTLAEAVSFCSNVLNKHCGVDQQRALRFLDGETEAHSHQTPLLIGSQSSCCAALGSCVGKELIYMATLGKPLVFSLAAAVAANVLSCSSTYPINGAVKETVVLKKPAA